MLIQAGPLQSLGTLQMPEKCLRVQMCKVEFCHICISTIFSLPLSSSVHHAGKSWWYSLCSSSCSSACVKIPPDWEGGISSCLYPGNQNTAEEFNFFPVHKPCCDTQCLSILNYSSLIAFYEPGPKSDRSCHGTLISRFFYQHLQILHSNRL